ncbi:Sigma-70 region 4 type 2 [Stanieria cyanosphaera PCC 7437]|uniref:Sigma-70 region 4 type 2 n=1 Tax=Stanieria cyanosphaera (strain ATCC 29371 / PCC 7437) TaxID=111780 RepID=K9XQD3_STAC7|nr:sigma-70 family RNA polymerase sigma factor [Stanieria cyanosphaera]AFZ33877.1 Sigma-70 region 4 type 2 [Stanieria cyanosphaera PCC 7437]
MISFESDQFSSSDELLKQLLFELQNSKKLFSQQQLLIARIVELILRSRPICRQFNGNIWGIYQEIYDQAKQQIFQSITQDGWQGKLDKINVSNWKNNLQKQTFKAILTDERLKQLGLEAQKAPPQSELRSYALTELIRAIQLSGKLCRPYQETFAPKFYQLLYEEAVVITFTYVCLHIELYDPERGKGKFMNWVNFRLEKAIIECRRKFNDSQSIELPNLKDLETINQPEITPLLSELLYRYIEEDVNQVFSQIHIRNRPDANFRAIALARFNGYSWEEIAENFQLTVSTLSRFYQRSCQKLAPLLKQEFQS